jgi:transcriptional antiterminator NusG
MSDSTQDDAQGTPPAATPPAAVGAVAGKKRWYVVHAYSGMEKSVQRRNAGTVRPDPGAD